MQSLQDLYTHKLQELYSAERQITRALPEMIEKASNSELRRGMEMHLQQTEQQIQRLEQLLEQSGAGREGEECVGMRGIIEEGRMMMGQVQDPDALDALIIAAQQSVEHYEIAGYGTARTWARQLGREQDAELLQQTLEEEEQTDKLLTRVAESMVNRDAAQGDREVSRNVERDVNLQQEAMGGGSARGVDDRPSADR